MPARILLAAALLALAACGGRPAPATSAGQPAQSAEAESTVGTTTVHVSAVQTSLLPEAVARRYGIERAPERILLLVNLRDMGTGAPPTITATVTDLQGHTTPVALREVRVDPADPQTVDHVGTVEATLPDTLRFEVVAHRAGATSTVQVARDFYPQ